MKREDTFFSETYKMILSQIRPELTIFCPNRIMEKQEELWI